MQGCRDEVMQGCRDVELLGILEHRRHCWALSYSRVN